MLVSDPYHSLRLTQIADEVGLKASVSSTDGASSIRQLVRETVAVSLGRILGLSAGRQLARRGRLTADFPLPFAMPSRAILRGWCNW